MNALSLLRQADELERTDDTPPAPFVERRDPAKTCSVHLIRRDELGRCTGCAVRRSR